MKKLLTTLSLIVGLAAANAGIYEINLNTITPGGLLTGANEVPANSSTATGGEAGIGLSYDSALGVLNLNLAYGIGGFQPLQGNYTASHIHQAPAGVNGSVVINLASIHTPIGTKAGIYAGTVAFPSSLETALWNNELYINIHSTAFPGGEIRAQLVPVTIPEPSALALVGLGLVALLARRRR